MPRDSYTLFVSDNAKVITNLETMAEFLPKMTVVVVDSAGARKLMDLGIIQAAQPAVPTRPGKVLNPKPKYL